MSKSIEQKYRKLSEVEHVLARPGRYVGSISLHTEDTYQYKLDGKKFDEASTTYSPAFLKLFDEVISNSVDHSKRPEGKALDTLKIEVDEAKCEISIYDNGGIPVVKHKEYDQWIAELIFELRAGSNFDDNDQAELTGQNGEGAALTNIFSSKFVVETCDGKNKFKMVFEDNSQTRNKPKISPAEGSKGFTRITYTPEVNRLGMEGIDADNVQTLLKRTVDVAGLNPHLKVYWNGTRINVKSFKDYVSMYLADDADVAIDETDKWRIAVAGSEGGFKHVSFVNGTHTKIGGTHVAYVTNQICDELRTYFKKKHKVDLKPSDIKNHLTIFIDANIVNPRYSSQTKEDLITEPRDYKTSWAVPDKLIKKLTNSSIIQSVLDWVEAKQKMEELKELRKLNKDGAKLNLKHIKKFNDASERDRSKTSLFLCEGDSAKTPILGSRDPRLHAVFPLRGRPINVSAAPLAKVKENVEFENVRIISGLKYGEVADPSEMNFGRIIIASDADEFGHSIAGLVINMFYRLWPDLIKSGRLYRLITPAVAVEHKKQTLFFDTMKEFDDWRAKNPSGYTYKFLKGLGSSGPKHWKHYFANLDKYLVQFKYDEKDKDPLDLCFLKEDDSADKRKEWLALE